MALRAFRKFDPMENCHSAGTHEPVAQTRLAPARVASAGRGAKCLSFQARDGGFDLTLTSAEIEWLLQVLNDVRVGCWLTLGEPEPGEEPEVSEENARYLIAMELCGLFESELLSALGVEQSPQWH